MANADKFLPYKVHPFADRFPLIVGDEFEELSANIKQNGLLDPIVLTADGSTIVDGRNRYLACLNTGVDPVFEELAENYTEVMILDLIVSRNIERRQLTAGQRDLLALDYERFYAKAAKAAQSAAGGDKFRNDKEAPDQDRPLPADLREAVCNTLSDQRADRVSAAVRRARESATRAAKVTGASGRGVQQAKAVERDAPDLADKVRRNEMSMDHAYRAARQRVRQQPKPGREKPSTTMLALKTHDGSDVSYPKPQAKATFNTSPGDGISWAEWSWNPVTGCLHGCDYCYARAIATSDRFKESYPVGFTPLFHHERLDAPTNTTIPTAHRGDPAWRRVFVCSMADLYGRWVPDEWIEQVHSSMNAAPWWEYLLLTKFPSRYVGLELPKNSWVGTSVDEQRRVRIAEDAFRQIDNVKVKWLSLEPLREPLKFTDLSMFDWVVIGAQTETRQPDGTVPANHPPFEWVADIVRQARDSGCRIHMKPNLRQMTLLDEYPGSASMTETP